MKNTKIIMFTLLLSVALISCESENINDANQDSLGATEAAAKLGNPFLNMLWVQEDQVARPAINTVFTPSNLKDMFNVTPPSDQGDMFQSDFEATLEVLNPAFADDSYVNLLGLNAPAFTGFLATDVLNISLVRPTTFFRSFDLYLTGRALNDDVIDVELLLIFGGPNGTDNPGLTSDNVDGNDKEFSSAFPYLASPHLN